MVEQNNRNSRQDLQTVLELWYAWLISNPDHLFSQEDLNNMQSSVTKFFQTAQFIGSSSVEKAEWFFDKGFKIFVDRWQKGDYDSYE